MHELLGVIIKKDEMDSIMGRQGIIDLIESKMKKYNENLETGYHKVISMEDARNRYEEECSYNGRHDYLRILAKKYREEGFEYFCEDEFKFLDKKEDGFYCDFNYHGKWDWWSIGGRFNDYLPSFVKDIYKSYLFVDSDLCNKKEGRNFTQINNIDFDKVDEYNDKFFLKNILLGDLWIELDKTFEEDYEQMERDTKMILTNHCDPEDYLFIVDFHY